MKKIIDRRNFLKIAGVSAAGFLMGARLSASGLEGNGQAGRGEYGASSVSRKLKVPKNKKAIILETKLVSKEPGRFTTKVHQIDSKGDRTATDTVLEPNRYCAWPTIAKLDNGDIVIVYSGDRDAHVCPWGKTRIIRSKDKGATWSAPETINNTPLDDRDAGVIQTLRGTLLVSWFTSLAYANPAWKASYQKYFRVAEKIPAELKEKWLGNWVRRSVDGGASWGEAVRTSATAPHGPIQLRDGRLLYVGNGSWKGQPALVAEQSLDDGLSWQVVSVFKTESGSIQGLSEPHVVETRSGKLVALFRNESSNEDKYLLQSESYDGGKSWTVLHETPIWGYPPHIIELQNGWLLVVYGHRRKPFAEKACISKDEGESWDIKNEITLAEAYNADHGYPASIQLDDGSIITVFYQQDNEGEPTSIFTTHWRLK